MRRYLPLHFLTALLIAASASGASSSLDDRSMAELETELSELDAELDQLARHSLRSGSGSIGFRSQWYHAAEQSEWVRIEFEKEYPIDQIALVPALWRDYERGFQADGFPEAYRITIGSSDNPDGTLLGEFNSPRDSIGIAPVVLSGKGISGSWILLETSRLSPRAFDNRFVLQLSEIFVFSGDENIALQNRVTVSSVHPGVQTPWHPQYLVDGHTPFIMNSARGNRTLAYLLGRSRNPSITFDLGEAYPLSGIHLHEAERSNTVPETDNVRFGMPDNLRILGANQMDFSDAFPLTEIRRISPTERGPIIMKKFPARSCRYVRITAPSIEPDFKLAFAEIELLAEGVNVAGGTPVQTIPNRTTATRSAESMVDGYNLYGQILPIRQWINELARRHELQTLRPLIVSELANRYHHQKAALNKMKWTAALLAFAAILIVLITQLVRQKQVSRLKERLAADLHDELGANLHTISLVSDLAKESIDNPEKLSRLLDRSRFFAERSAAAARSCINTLEAKGICDDLIDEMQRSSDRILADLEHDFSYSGEAWINDLKARKRIDLFLFFKECLTNIIRHAKASHVSIALDASKKWLHLKVTDNGSGKFDAVPPSLKRRAHLLGAKITMEHPSEGGTSIALKLKQRNPILLFR